MLEAALVWEDCEDAAPELEGWLLCDVAEESEAAFEVVLLCEIVEDSDSWLSPELLGAAVGEDTAETEAETPCEDDKALDPGAEAEVLCDAREGDVAPLESSLL